MHPPNNIHPRDAVARSDSGEDHIVIIAGDLVRVVLPIASPETTSRVTIGAVPGVVIANGALKGGDYEKVLSAVLPQDWEQKRKGAKKKKREKHTTASLSNAMNLQCPRVRRQREAQAIEALPGDRHAGGMAPLLAAVGDPRGEISNAGVETVEVRAGSVGEGLKAAIGVQAIIGLVRRRGRGGLLGGRGRSCGSEAEGQGDESGKEVHFDDGDEC